MMDAIIFSIFVTTLGFTGLYYGLKEYDYVTITERSLIFHNENEEVES